MLRMVICCGGGYSSSCLAKLVQKEIIDRNLSGEVSVVFKPFARFKEDHSDFDIALLCPHLLYDAKNFVKENTVDFPLYMIPSQMYGTMRLDDLMKDSVDLIKVFSENHENIAHFPDEGLIEMKRNISHRAWLKRQAALKLQESIQ